jgi:hypothetical protein
LSFLLTGWPAFPATFLFLKTMPLFTDSDHVTQADLQAIDAELPQVASAQKLSLEGPLGIIRANWDECSGIMDRALGQRNLSGVDPVIAWHTNRIRKIGLNQITLAPQYANSVSPWKRWLIYEALRRCYRAATQRNANNDRFQLKFEQYGEDADAAWRRACSFGLPVVFAPISAPGALHDLGAGVWSTSNLISISQSPSTSDRTIYCAITWVASAASSNGESAGSEVVSISLTASQGVRVSIAGLNPPGSSTHPSSRAGAYYPTGKASHWNVYAGSDPASLCRQNLTPIPVTTQTYDLTGALAAGVLLGDGQTYDTLEPLTNIIYRA